MLQIYEYRYRTGDNRECRLFNLWDMETRQKKGPILMVAGVGVRANVFRPQGQRTLVECLLDRGYDVWLEDWRACIEWGASPHCWPNDKSDKTYYLVGRVNKSALATPPPWENDHTAEKDKNDDGVRWSLDHAALYDHPYAVKTVVEITGSKRIKAIVHCIGSISFIMAAVAGHLPEVSRIVSNAVSLHPVVPTWTYLKSRLARPLVSRSVSYLDAQWGSTELAPNWLAQAIVWSMHWFHFECLNPVCKLASFSYGVGVPKMPVLWRHENLRPEIHEWIKNEFGKVLLRVFEHLETAWKIGNMVRLEDLDGLLPADYTAQPPKLGEETRIAFFAGELNACFLKESQERTFDFFNRMHKRDHHSLHIIPGYGHLDMFIGKRAAQDVFPLMLAELER